MQHECTCRMTYQIVRVSASICPCMYPFQGQHSIMVCLRALAALQYYQPICVSACAHAKV